MAFRGCVEQVTVFKFPPNVTSVFQPMDQGVIAALKAGYKSRLLAKMVETADVYNTQLQVMAKLKQCWAKYSQESNFNTNYTIHSVCVMVLHITD